MDSSPTPALIPDTTYAVLPTWVLDSGISDRAVRLYAVLARYANDERGAWPSRTTLARRMGCSPDSVDRALRELVAEGAVTITARYGTAGQTSNLYYLHTVPAGMSRSTPAAPVRRGGPHPCGGGGRTRAAQNQSQENVNPPSPPQAGGDFACRRHHRPRRSCPDCQAGPPTRPDWCGLCDETTRLTLDDHPRRCGMCHPLEVR